MAGSVVSIPIRDRLVRLTRSVFRRVGGVVSRPFHNPDVRFLLNPSEAIHGEAAPIHLGAHSYFNGSPRVHRYSDDDATVAIGKYCSIGNDVEFMLSGHHHADWVSTYPHHARTDEVFSRGEIVIGNDVWIGRDVMIFSGVRIGDGAIVGAGSIVTKDVGPYDVVAGVDARKIRRRFSGDQVRFLLELGWWDWPDKLVEAYAPLLQSDDVDGFLAAAHADPRVTNE